MIMVKSEQKILIVTPLYPPDMGGPATYAHGLLKAMKEGGIWVEVVTFTKFLRYPSGIRHLLFCAHVFKKMKGVHSVIVLDTVSVAIPTVLASLLRRKKLIIRIGGDFVWERFIERTKKKILLSQFYTLNQPLSLKEKMLIWVQRNFVLACADQIAFSTSWQRDLWKTPYFLHAKKIKVIENAYAVSEPGDKGNEKPQSKAVIWIGRDIVLKNVDVLDRAMERVQKDFPETQYKKYTGINHDEVMKALAGARLLVIPSVSEVSPNLALEAIQLGVPVLLTRDCGIKDIIKDSVVWIDSLDEHDVHTQIALLMNEEAYARAQEKTRAFKSDRTYAEIVQDFLN